jgi:DNA-binding response OmpR family regulator
MLTNYPSAHARAKSLEEGADYFFDKSAEFDELIVVIKKYLKENISNDEKKTNINKSVQIINKSGVV